MRPRRILALLAAAAVAAAAGRVAAADRVTVVAHDATLVRVVADVARQARLTIHGGVPGGDVPVAIELADVPVEAALARLLRGGSYVLGYSDGRLSDVWLVSAPETPPAAVTRTAAPRPARKPAEDALRRGLADPSPAARLAWLAAGQPVPAPILAEHALRDPEPAVRAEALARLSAHDAFGADVLRAATADPDPEVRALAHGLLGRPRPSAADDGPERREFRE
jgi:hypothetical protein